MAGYEMSRCLWLLLVTLLSFSSALVIGRGELDPSMLGGGGPYHHAALLPANDRQVRWAKAAYDYIRSINCREVFFTTERECRTLVQVPMGNMTIYLADPSPFGRLTAVLPDGGLSKSGSHDAVLVVDPYPSANFGHLVVVFYVDLYTSRLWCHREGGIYLDGDECLILALKRRCKNALERRNRRRNFARRCEVNFLPLVHRESDSRRDQLLFCRPTIPGFGKCPIQRPSNETSEIVCNHLRDNTRRCETTHDTVHTKCGRYMICDQAVVISGGWNQLTSLQRHKDNVQQVYRTLRTYGFKRANVELFFANGFAGGVPVTDEEPHDVHPAALKVAMRLHLERLCGTLHCVDSLLLYLNSPSRSDGTMLLWDVDSDGEASEREQYTVEELMSDLEGCQARQVQVIVDQSFSGEITRAFRRSTKHNNVAVFASSRDNEYSWNSDFTDVWLRHNHTHACARDVHREAKRVIMKSSPETWEGSDVKGRTIFGAPCDILPPFTARELHQDYFGCQDLPTSVYVERFMSDRQQTAAVTEARSQSDLWGG